MRCHWEWMARAGERERSRSVVDLFCTHIVLSVIMFQQESKAHKKCTVNARLWWRWCLARIWTLGLTQCKWYRRVCVVHIYESEKESDRDRERATARELMETNKQIKCMNLLSVLGLLGFIFVCRFIVKSLNVLNDENRVARKMLCY